ncbi:hypothetical protein Daus18300_003921 [Diaporthe australafricana]|uniref:Uncharacterized protein n=1 Tax=Diaporthe australafricana TaxID=127596 RepID=A0ABR3XCC7_9PEZI
MVFSFRSTTAFPDDTIHPRDGPHAERGFTRNVNELRSVSAGIWSKIFSLGSLSSKFSRCHGTGDLLTVKELLTRTFIPDKEYTNKSLEIPKVKAYVITRKLEVPVYMITGLMIATGASWSSKKTKMTEAAAEAGLVEPASNASVGGSAGYTRNKERTTGVEDSNDFVLGIRVRKIWWEKGIRQTSDRVVGRVLESKMSTVNIGSHASLRIVDDFELDDPETSSADKRFCDESAQMGSEPIVWILH